MPITLDCPRCKQSLAVPSKMAGSYVNCPRCSGRFWVPEGTKDAGLKSAPEMPAIAAPPSPERSSWTAPAELAGRASVAAPPVSTSAGAPIARPPMPPGPPVPPPPPGGLWPEGAHSPPAAPAAPPPVTMPLVPPPRPAGTSPSVSPAPPPPSLPPSAPAGQPGGKVARFIVTDAAASTLKLAEDGKLPELHLQEGQDQRREDKSSQVHPMVLIGLICLSVALSIGLLVVDVGGDGKGAAQGREKVWRAIEKDYFPAEAGAPLQPYQRYLREARQAAARGDRKTEVNRLRTVLALLRAEGGALSQWRAAEQSGDRRAFDSDRWAPEKTLTGRLENDERLEKHIASLLREK